MNRSGWLFLGTLAALCLALAALQYRWTGELSRAEEQRTRAALADDVQQVATAVSGEMRRSVRQLLPRADELDALGGRQAHESRYQDWLEQEDRRLFSRIGVARPRKGGVLELSVFHDGQLSAAEWPDVWKEFRKQAEARLREDGEPPFTPADATWIEVPVWGEEGEREWLLLELDMKYVQSTWLPALVKAHLNSDLFVWRAVRADGAVVAGDGRQGRPDAEAGIFPTHFPRDRHDETRWQLQVWHRDGSLETAIRGARWRNLAVSGILLALIMAAGVALLRYNQRARETMAVERRFFASVSHELRTPLTAIRAAGQSLADDVVKGDDQRRQYAGIIVRQAEQLSDLVDQVLHFSAVGAGSGEVGLEAVLESARESASGEIRAAGCEVEMTIAPGLPKVRGDASALRRLFQNLLTNAARHGGQGKWIGVDARAGKGEVVVTVRDRGPGLTPSELGQLFTPFFRGEAARSKQTRGVGIGLSLVREIAEAHGGSVTAANDNGAVFTVRLPMATA
jgi:signal transduction histidine kinase